MVPQRYIDLAKAATPEELHAAVLRFSLDQVWDQPWMVYRMGALSSTKELLVQLDLPYHLEWPESNCRGEAFSTRCRETGAWTDPVAVVVPTKPVSVELMWRLAIVTGRPVLSYPHGMEGKGMLIPSDTSASQEVETGPEGLSNAYGGIVVCPGRLDPMQCTLLRSLDPVAIQGFPKFAWEQGTITPFKIKGRAV